jgi:VanZ family protein
MIRTGILSGHEEHFLAYLISGVVVAAASRRSHYAKLACALCLYAALLELGQYAVPGRHPAFEDFSASSFGALMGIGVITMVRTASRRLGAVV